MNMKAGMFVLKFMRIQAEPSGKLVKRSQIELLEIVRLSLDSS